MLEHLTATETIVTALLVIFGALGAAWGWWVRRGKPSLGRVLAVWDALTELLFGKAAEPPNPITGAPAVPAVLGIGPRLTEQEHTTALLVENVALLTKQQAATDEMVRQIADIRHELGEFRARLEQVESGVIERVAGKAESVAAWRAVEAVARQTDPIAPEIEE